MPSIPDDEFVNLQFMVNTPSQTHIVYIDFGFVQKYNIPQTSIKTPTVS